MREYDRLVWKKNILGTKSRFFSTNFSVESNTDRFQMDHLFNFTEKYQKIPEKCRVRPNFYFQHAQFGYFSFSKETHKITGQSFRRSCFLVLHIKSVLGNAQTPHVFSAPRIAEHELFSVFEVRLTLDLKSFFVINYVADVFPP